MNLLYPLALLLAVGSVEAGEESVPAATAVQELHWLAGSWCAESEDGSQEEHWVAPRGGVLLGVHRDTGPAGRVFFEFLRIQQEDDGIYYYASPAGRQPTPFRLVESSPGSAVFENPEHDFPQRIRYTRSGDRLEARVEGRVDGETRGSSWFWAADGCGFLESGEEGADAGDRR